MNSIKRTKDFFIYPNSPTAAQPLRRTYISISKRGADIPNLGFTLPNYQIMQSGIILLRGKDKLNL